MKNSTLELVYISLLAALTALGIVFFRIPAFGGNMYFHLGETIILTSALILGRKGGFLVGAIGSAIGDTLLGSFVPWAPISFIIHGIEGYIVGSFSDGKAGKKDLLGLVYGVILMIAGYTFAVGYLYGKPAMPIEFYGDTIQGIVGIIFAWFLAPVLRKNVPTINNLKNK